LFCLGEVASAHTHLEQGIALYDPQQHCSHAFLYGIDPGMACCAYAAWALWLLGYPAQALLRSHEALALARKLSHLLSLAQAMCTTGWLHQFRRETQAAKEQVEEAIALCIEQGFPFFLALGTIIRGWVLVAQNQGEEGRAQICQGLAAWRATGAKMFRPYWLALLAEAHRNAGQVEEGLSVLAEALAAVDKTGERFYEAELYRLKGELLLRQSACDAQQAETCFHQALDVARRQQAKSLELRTAMSLARLWQQQGQQAKAYALLAPVYNWFTEGFDTADLQEAKVLLEELV
jgi:predicted ATPase